MTIANHLKRSKQGIALYLMVAGIGTVCDDASIDNMEKTMGNCVSVKTYPEGTHSIHNSARNDFMAATCDRLNDVIWIRSLFPSSSDHVSCQDLATCLPT